MWIDHQANIYQFKHVRSISVEFDFTLKPTLVWGVADFGLHVIHSSYSWMIVFFLFDYISTHRSIHYCLWFIYYKINKNNIKRNRNFCMKFYTVKCLTLKWMKVCWSNKIVRLDTIKYKYFPWFIKNSIQSWFGRKYQTKIIK